MTETCIASAPGKLALFGEHAVVHGRHCIVTAIDKRMWVKVTRSNQTILTSKQMGLYNYIIKDGVNYPKEVAYVARAIQRVSGYLGRPIKAEIETWSDFSADYGFGSSSAVTVSIIKALMCMNDLELNDKTLFELSYGTVIDVQGRHNKSGQPLASGFDVAAAIYGGTIDFSKNEVVVPLRSGQIPLLVAYSGSKASTVELVNRVTELCLDHKVFCEALFNISDQIVQLAKGALAVENWEELGKLMTINHGLLSSLGVSSIKLDSLVSASINAGAYGAKLSGAGGGDCIIAIVERDTRLKVENAIKREGGTIINVNLNAEGARIDKKD
ncbi:MAG: mevalonate kinase [Conexivisphaerales archaeon]